MNLSAISLKGSGDAAHGVTPATFFDRVCAFLFDHRSAFCRDVGGRYAFDLAGAGSWTLDFDETRVEEGARDAQLTVRMSADDFGSFLQGKLDVNEAMADGRFSYDGERSLFSILAAFTRPVAPPFPSGGS